MMHLAGPDGRPMTLLALEKAAIEFALWYCFGNATKASKCLGIGRTTFYRKLDVYGLRHLLGADYRRGYERTLDQRNSQST